MAKIPRLPQVEFICTDLPTVKGNIHVFIFYGMGTFVKVKTGGVQSGS